MKNNSDSIIEYTTSPHLEITGNGECVVDGLKKICEFSSDKIKFSLGKFSVIFSGADLSIASFSQGGAVVSGTIIRLEFEGDA